MAAIDDCQWGEEGGEEELMCELCYAEDVGLELRRSLCHFTFRAVSWCASALPPLLRRSAHV